MAQLLGAERHGNCGNLLSLRPFCDACAQAETAYRIADGEQFRIGWK